LTVGNTNIVLGVFEGEQSSRAGGWRRCASARQMKMGIWVSQLFEHRSIDAARITGIVMGSLVPPLTGTFIKMRNAISG
jgi:pantothenate kinase type III